MPITIIDKLKQPNNLTFKIIDSIDVEHTYMDDTNVEQSISLKDYLDELDEKIKSSGVAVDTSLAIEGAAADAKSVGDAINAVRILIGDTAVSTQIETAIENIQALTFDEIDTICGSSITAASEVVY